MDIMAMIEKTLLEGYATSEITIPTIFTCIGFTAVIAVFICLVYKLSNKKSFYNRSFELSLFELAIITAAIILTIQSNIVVSLGMVGALSIVRFRTAIKEPMDLTFLFWSISVGIICGAGYAMIAVIGSVALTIAILVFSMLPASKGTMILVVDAADNREDAILDVVHRSCSMYKVRARSITGAGVNIAVEVRTDHPDKLIEGVKEIDDIISVSLVEHDGEVTA